MINEVTIKEIISNVIAQMGNGEKSVPVEVSARHVHLSQKDVELLFGTGYQLTNKRPLSQPGQFLAEERVSIVTGKGEFRNVAVLGPARENTQVEISMTDAKSLGIKAPVRLSGNVVGCPSICIFSKNTMIEATSCVVVAQNHIHMTKADASYYGVCDGQKLRIKMNTLRPVTFEDVIVRVSDSFRLAMHIDFDEANGCGFETNDTGIIKA